MFFPNNKKGFSLIELLMYIGVLGIAGGLLTAVFYQVSVTQNREMASTEVSQQLQFAMDRIQGLVRESAAIGEIHEGTTRGTACTSFCSLRLVMPQTNINPTIISSDANGIYVQQGAAGAVPITSGRVRISSLRFQKHANPGGKATVSIDLSLAYNTTNPLLAVTNTLTSAVGRVSAATFDSDLLPDVANIRNVGGTNLGWRRVLVGDGSASDPSYSFGSGTAMGLFRPAANVLGFSTNSIERMRIDATGNVGIGTTGPEGKLHIKQAVQVRDDANFYGGGLVFENPGTAHKYYMGYGYGGVLRFGGFDTTTYKTGMVMTFDGNVGIGTTGPNTALDVSGAISVRGMAAPSVSPTGQGRIYFDSTANRFRVSQHGAAYVDLVGGGGTPGGTSGAVQFNSAGVFGGDAANLFWDNANKRLGIGTIAPRAKLHIVGASGDETIGNVIIGSDSLADANLRMGWLAGSRSWIQSHANLPLHINRLGNNVILNALAGNVGIGTTAPLRQFQIDFDVDGIGFDGRTASPDAGVFRFGDNTGWKLHFGRSRENAFAAVNTGITGTLLTIQDNGNVGIGTTGPDARLNVVYTSGVQGVTSVGPSGNTHIPFTDGRVYISGVDIVFRDSVNTERMRLVGSTGNVGIGTMTPGARLHVASGLIKTGTRAVKQGLSFVDSCGTTRVTSVHNGIWAPDHSGGCGDEWFMGVQDRDGGEASTLVIGMWNDANDHIALIPSGNVGIGTMRPSTRLDVQGNLLVGSGGTFSNIDGWNGVIDLHGEKHSRLSVRTGAGAIDLQLFSHSLGWAGALAGSVVGTQSIHPLSFMTKGISRVTIDTIGNVGIGTIAPSGILSVTPAQYNIGIASQSLTTITGVGTAFTPAMVGSQFVFANGISAGTITAFNSPTSLTVSTSQTVALHAYNIAHTGLQVERTGNVGIGTTAPGTNRLKVVGGPIKAAGGLIIETRTSDPASPVAGQMWLRTDL